MIMKFKINLTISIFCTIIIFKINISYVGLLPIILIIKKKNYKFFKDFRIIFKIIFITLFRKNLINTGCFIYPVSDSLL